MDGKNNKGEIIEDQEGKGERKRELESERNSERKSERKGQREDGKGGVKGRMRGRCSPSEELPIDALSITPHSNSPNLNNKF